MISRTQASDPSHTNNALPSISVIVEWENAKLSELERARTMLRVLSAQASQLKQRFTAPPELVLVYDREAIDPSSIECLITSEIGRDSGLVVRMAPTEGLDYYGQKNHGASMARGDLIVFLDSDVIPEEGWLQALIESASDHPGAVVSGRTYLDPVSFLGRAFGLFWFFPLRSESTGIVPTKGFFANSVALPRALFVTEGFTPAATVRGQCTLLAERYRASGVSILRVEDALASHPAPNGFVHLIRRALCQGHDARTLEALRQGQPPWWKSILRTMVRFLRNCARAGKRIIIHRRAVGMPLWEVPFSLVLAGGYYLVFMVGELISLVAPTVIPGRLAV